MVRRRSLPNDAQIPGRCFRGFSCVPVESEIIFEESWDLEIFEALFDFEAFDSLVLSKDSFLIPGDFSRGWRGSFSASASGSGFTEEVFGAPKRMSMTNEGVKGMLAMMEIICRTQEKSESRPKIANRRALAEKVPPENLFFLD